MYAGPNIHARMYTLFGKCLQLLLPRLVAYLYTPFHYCLIGQINWLIDKKTNASVDMPGLYISISRKRRTWVDFPFVARQL